MTELEQHVLAYWLAGPANDFNVATRWYPYGELVMILEDKFRVATRKFGSKAGAKAKTAATTFLDTMIEKGGWSTTENKFGGKMHQFQADTYRPALKQMQERDPLVQQAKAEGDGFWQRAFARLTA
ncbi:MAG: hypothetical protein JF593_09295 [Novosphingobium sp.]|nr:hypothetical protein [Novosphingobium sp.]